MTTYKSLYHLMVRSMSEAIDLYDEGKGILAREVLKKALLDAEEQVITHHQSSPCIRMSSSP